MSEDNNQYVEHKLNRAPDKLSVLMEMLSSSILAMLSAPVAWRLLFERF